MQLMATFIQGACSTSRLLWDYLGSDRKSVNVFDLSCCQVWYRCSFVTTLYKLTAKEAKNTLDEMESNNPSAPGDGLNRPSVDVIPQLLTWRHIAAQTVRYRSGWWEEEEVLAQISADAGALEPPWGFLMADGLRDVYSKWRHNSHEKEECVAIETMNLLWKCFNEVNKSSEGTGTGTGFSHSRLYDPTSCCSHSPPAGQ